jgi:Flp pilus assembly protein TadD
MSDWFVKLRPILAVLLLAACGLVIADSAVGELTVADAPTAAAPGYLSENPLVRPPADPEDILALNDRLRYLADTVVKPVRPRGRQIEALVGLMFDSDKLGLLYKGDKTLTAIQTLEAGGGNCISLTNLFIAMARYVGMDTHYLSITTPPNWNIGEDFYYVTRHVSALVKSTNSLRGKDEITVDFRWFGPTSMARKEIVSDNRGFAEYYSNIAVDAFEAGDLHHALRYAEKATEIDPRYSYAWSNIGVIYRRLDRHDDAEQAYKTALKINRRNPSALSNLVVLYTTQGREQDAAKYAREVEKYRMKNPYYLYRLAESAAAEGNHKDAIKLLKRAIRKNKEEDKFYFALARAYHLTNNDKLAIKFMKKAREQVSSVEEKTRYQKKLNYLESQHN